MTSKAAAAVIVAAVVYLLRRELLRLYLACRDVVTKAPPCGVESWLYWKVEE